MFGFPRIHNRIDYHEKSFGFIVVNSYGFVRLNWLGFLKMMKKLIAVAVIGIFGLGLTACAGNDQNETGGAIIGGVIGGLLGSQVGGGKGRIVSSAAGAALGVFLGSRIGKKLDKVDQMHAARTQQTALETNPAGQSSSWTNPDTGNSGTVTPTKTVASADNGQPCREYQHSVTIGGKTEQAYGRACRQADGSWQIVN
jgi:surface antigen